MNKRFALFLVAMLVFAALLSACSADSKDAGKDYMEAVLKGEDAKALDLACESFDGTQTLLDFFRKDAKVIPGTVDLQVDMAKTNNQEKLRVTGSVECAKDATFDCGKNNEFVFSEKKGTRYYEESLKYIKNSHCKSFRGAVCFFYCT